MIAAAKDWTPIVFLKRVAKSSLGRLITLRGEAISEAKLVAKVERNRLQKSAQALPLEEDLVSYCNEKHIVVLQERFSHDRRSLEPMIEKITRREHMVEVGSLIGFSTRLFAHHFNRVYSVDPYTPGYDDRHDLNSERFRLQLARDLFTIRFLDEPRVVQYREPSAKACLRFENRSLDFVYLDGSHTYEAVIEDINCWKPKVRPGGFIGGDDFGWSGVRQAVDEAVAGYKIIDGRWLAHIE